MLSPFSRIATECRHELQKVFVEKRLYQVAPHLRPVPNPLSREYLLLIQQQSRLAFADSMQTLAAEPGLRWWRRFPKYLSAYFMLKATTAIVNSLVTENRLTQGPDHLSK